jgi:hypothetical protein
MRLIYRGRARARVFVFFFLTIGLALTGAAHAADAPLRIRNGHKMTVRLGKTREAAFGIRPQKQVWTLELTAELVGAVAELEDVTPRWQNARLSVPIDSERVVLDARFLPDHVYRLEILRARQLVGSTLIYLYPPPVERVKRVEFERATEAPAHRDKSVVPGVRPKGGL